LLPTGRTSILSVYIFLFEVILGSKCIQVVFFDGGHHQYGVFGGGTPPVWWGHHQYDGGTPPT